MTLRDKPTMGSTEISGALLAHPPLKRATSGATQVKASLHIFRQLGPFTTLLFPIDKVLGCLTGAQILILVVPESEALADLDPKLPAGFTVDVRRPEAMGNLSAACAAELRHDFLEEASNNGDQCIAILEHDHVVSFQWLSEGLTRAYDDIWIGFGPRYLNGYNSFTAPSHRGKHLNRSGVGLSAQMLAVPHGKGLAGFIRASNRKSAGPLPRLTEFPWNRAGLAVWPAGTARPCIAGWAQQRCEAGPPTAPAPGASMVAAARLPSSIPETAGSLQR